MPWPMLTCLPAVVASITAAPSEPGFRAGFDAGLAGWRQAGQAEFAVDTAEKHGGAQAARITIAPGTPLTWQQLFRTFGPVRPGDSFRASVWVRIRGVTDGTGAYAALQFLDAGGQRIGIEHTKLSLANGSAGWERLTVEGKAPDGTAQGRLDLILNSVGTAWFDDVELVRTGTEEPWPDLGAAERHLTVHPDYVVLDHFAGVGYHVFHHVHTMSPELMDEVVYKRWRELNPSFARLNDQNGWDAAMLEQVAGHLRRLKATGTELYLAAWDPQDTQPGEERRAYAKQVVDRLEWLVRRQGLDNLRWYCLTNELSLGGWGKLIDDLPKFKDYHQELHDELKRRGLPIGLLATDASPVGRWSSIEWAARNMDAITAVYGGHEYFNSQPPDDERFYGWFLDKLTWAAGVAREKGKDFILGEFGSKQDGRVLNGVKMDACVYWDSPTEPLVTLQLAEAAIACLNAGVYGLGYWTFMDFPDDYSRTYANKWGLFKWSGEDMSTRAPYYGYGLLSKFFRGPGATVKVEVDDPWLRAGALRRADGSWSIAVVNRYRGEAPLRLALPVEGSRQFRKYVYDSAKVEHHPFGDLPGPAAVVELRDGRMADRLAPGSLTVYTTAYDDQPPAAVRDVSVAAAEGGRRVSWQAGATPDLCYYRVYRGDRPGFTPSVANQIRSTIATQVVDRKAPAGAVYAVVPVDQSGNAGAVTYSR